MEAGFNWLRIYTDMGFGISCFETSGSATRVLFIKMDLG
jgi:hypothetical protein